MQEDLIYSKALSETFENAHKIEIELEFKRDKEMQELKKMNEMKHLYLSTT